jgi:enterochelin esterase-like enzyme
MAYALERFTLASPNSPAREITVYRPESAGPRSDGLPLLVLHDGQNLFDPDRAHVPGLHWRVAETAEALVADGRLRPVLIAGIDHAAEGRIAEFTPTPGDQPGCGQVARYGRFVMEDLVPHLARAYGAGGEARNVALGGSSLGGLATLMIARQFPGRLGRLLVMSPSVWWDDRVVLRRLHRVGFQPRPRVWLDIGRREGAKAIADARALRSTLLWQTSALRYVEDPEGDHSERAWARRLPEALEWLWA